ncbi:hypothetical protein B7494_g1203 [Chlorociboria aeruginascens]|nr:hypothetical protein B7494_g1203 [Chlorociboria aeruginascens]
MRGNANRADRVGSAYAELYFNIALSAKIEYNIRIDFLVRKVLIIPDDRFHRSAGINHNTKEVLKSTIDEKVGSINGLFWGKRTERGYEIKRLLGDRIFKSVFVVGDINKKSFKSIEIRLILILFFLEFAFIVDEVSMGSLQEKSKRKEYELVQSIRQSSGTQLLAN